MLPKKVSSSVKMSNKMVKQLSNLKSKLQYTPEMLKQRTETSRNKALYRLRANIQ